jgi:hypothetical protein
MNSLNLHLASLFLAEYRDFLPPSRFFVRLPKNPGHIYLTWEVVASFYGFSSLTTIPLPLKDILRHWSVTLESSTIRRLRERGIPYNKGPHVKACRVRALIEVKADFFPRAGFPVPIPRAILSRHGGMEMEASPDFELLVAAPPAAEPVASVNDVARNKDLGSSTAAKEFSSRDVPVVVSDDSAASSAIHREEPPEKASDAELYEFLSA